MTRDFLIGITFGTIGLAGMVSFYLSKHRQIAKENYEETLMEEDVEDDRGSDADEFFDAETGSEILLFDTNDSWNGSDHEIVKTNDVGTETDRHSVQTFDAATETDLHTVQKCDAATETGCHIIENNEYTIMMEQRLKSLEDKLVLLRTEKASTTRNESKNRISIRLYQDPSRTQCHQMHCHTCTPHANWAYLPPGSQPVYTGPVIPPPLVYSVPMSPPPPVHSVPMSPPPPVHSVPMSPPPPVHSVSMSPPPPEHTGPIIPPPPVNMSPPPPPSATTGFGFAPPPPPPPMMVTSTPEFQSNSQKTVEGTSLEGGPDKKAPICYGRIPITPEILKSVILKPPGERILKKR